MSWDQQRYEAVKARYIAARDGGLMAKYRFFYAVGIGGDFAWMLKQLKWLIRVQNILLDIIKSQPDGDIMLQDPRLWDGQQDNRRLH